jgi:hypothetical protein
MPIVWAIFSFDPSGDSAALAVSAIVLIAFSTLALSIVAAASRDSLDHATTRVGSPMEYVPEEDERRAGIQNRERV